MGNYLGPAANTRICESTTAERVAQKAFSTAIGYWGPRADTRRARGRTVSEFILEIAGEGFEGQRTGANLIVPLCYAAGRNLTLQPQDRFRVLQAVLNQTYDSIITSRYKNNTFIVPDASSINLSEVVFKRMTGFPYNQFDKASKVLLTQDEIDSLILRRFICRPVPAKQTSVETEFASATRVAALGVAYAVLTINAKTTNPEQNSSKEKSPIEIEIQIINKLNTRKKMYQSIYERTAKYQLPPSRKAQEQAEAEVQALKGQKIEVTARDGRTIIVTKWSQLEDAQLPNIQEQVLQSRIAQNNSQLDPAEKQRARNRIKFAIAAELAYEQLCTGFITKQRYELFSQDIDYYYSCGGKKTDRQQLSIYMETLYAIRSALCVNEQELNDPTLLNVVFDGVTRKRWKPDNKELIAMVQIVKQLSAICTDLPKKEIEDSPSRREVFLFQLKIAKALIMDLPAFDLSRQKTTTGKMAALLTSLQKYWQAEVSIPIDSSAVRKQLEDDTCDNFVITQFCCLFSQIGRLAKLQTAERAEYITLNPLRSDFPYVLPYLIILNRLLLKNALPQLRLELIVGDTDDEDALALVDISNSDSEIGIIVRERKRIIMSKFRAMFDSVGITANVTLYSDSVPVTVREKQLGQVTRFAYNPLVWQRTEQQVTMLAEQQSSNPSFAEFLKSQRLTLDDIGRRFGLMYVAQGQFFAKAARTALILETATPNSKAEIYRLASTLGYTPVNIYPATDRTNKILDL